MIKKLRRKFVLAAMLSLLLVLGLLIGIINVLNYRSVVTEADETLLAVSENNRRNQMMPAPDESEAPDGRERDDGKDRRQFQRFDGEAPFRWRYFSVTLDESGEASAIDVRNIATVDEETALSMALAAAKKGREKGFSGNYRYLGVKESAGTRWTFLNRELELGTARTFLLTSSLISLTGFVMVFLLLVPLSARIVRPIAQSYEKQKRFITDAGHELKTPITIIRADADVLGEDLRENEWIADIRKQTERLSTLTNDLIYLSRMEEERKPQMTDFPLSEIVQETAKPFQAVALTQNKTFSVDAAPMLTLHGDERSVRKLVSILLDNAMKYSPDGGSIALSLKKAGRQIRLTVTNTAEGVEKGAQDRLFDRFYRTDASRNSETGGFGLGLAIAKAVAESHRGRIRAFSPDGASLTVEATFPE